MMLDKSKLSSLLFAKLSLKQKLLCAAIAIAAIFVVAILTEPSYAAVDLTAAAKAQLNAQFAATTSDQEFFGFIGADGNFHLMGIKNLSAGGGSTIAGVDLPEGATFVHSHPNNSCIPSDSDKSGAKQYGMKISCIICGVNKLACYNV